jgi:YD repeat-containing protein
MQARIILTVVLTILATAKAAQARPPEESTERMSDREQRGLRGPVKVCSEESTYPARENSEGKSTRQAHSQYTTEYDIDGRILSTRIVSPDGSQWITRSEYDRSGRPVKTTSGAQSKVPNVTTYSYDQQGRLYNISADNQSETPITFRYDEHGRKIKIEVSRPEDYQADVAIAGSPFAALDRAPNLPGGGTATTIYDDHDRPTEVQVHDALGELVNRGVRTYDALGRIVEEKQVLENLETIFPAEIRAKLGAELSVSEADLRRELRVKISNLMAGQSGPYSVSYSYDDRGQVTHTSRRVFNRCDEIETTYNQHGDPESEITLGSNTSPSSPSHSEVRNTYQYDEYDNWIRKAVSYRSSPDGEFQPSTVITRTLTYY